MLGLSARVAHPSDHSTCERAGSGLAGKRRPRSVQPFRETTITPPVHKAGIALLGLFGLGGAEVVEGLRSTGVTMVIVEQSVNVALSIADRAIFMERGRVRFEGPASELLERDDLLRAVFLSGEGA